MLSTRDNPYDKMLVQKSRRKKYLFSPLKIKETYPNAMYFLSGEDGTWKSYLERRGREELRTGTEAGPAVWPDTREDTLTACPQGSSGCPCPDPGRPGSRHSLGEVGQVLGNLGDEGEGAGRAVIGVLLQQVEE